MGVYRNELGSSDLWWRCLSLGFSSIWFLSLSNPAPFTKLSPQPGIPHSPVADNTVISRAGGAIVVQVCFERAKIHVLCDTHYTLHVIKPRILLFYYESRLSPGYIYAM